MRHYIPLLLLIGLFHLPLSAQNADKEHTRILIILDCSNSMWDHWQSNAKIKVTQQVLLSLLDSVGQQHETEVALRVFGHLNKESFGTRLEVPFSSDNTYRLQSKIKTLVPQGGCTAATALTDALADFPSDAHSRNLILIITDGMDDCDAEICDVARQVQLSGVVVQTFVLGIGSSDSFRHTIECAGSFFRVADEEHFMPTLHNIFRLSGKKAKVSLSIHSSQGHPSEATHPIVFYDHQTSVSRLSTLHSNASSRPDTLLLDPLVTYDMAILSNPPVRREGLRFSIDHFNPIDITLNEGTLTVQATGRQPQGSTAMPSVVVHRADGSTWVGRQQVGEEVDYLAGRYDIEVLTLPITTFRGIEVREASTTRLTIPTAGQLVLSKPKGITTGVILQSDNGRIQHVCDLNPSTSGERLMLQPGSYEVVLKPQRATSYNDVATRHFVIESGKTTNVQF